MPGATVSRGDSLRLQGLHLSQRIASSAASEPAGHTTSTKRPSSPFWRKSRGHPRRTVRRTPTKSRHARPFAPSSRRGLHVGAHPVHRSPLGTHVPAARPYQGGGSMKFRRRINIPKAHGEPGWLHKRTANEHANQNKTGRKAVHAVGDHRLGAGLIPKVPADALDVRLARHLHVPPSQSRGSFGGRNGPHSVRASRAAPRRSSHRLLRALRRDVDDQQPADGLARTACAARRSDGTAASPVGSRRRRALRTLRAVRRPGPAAAARAGGPLPAQW